MATDERRKHRRTRLRLRISRIEGLAAHDAVGDVWTRDISPGGMYLQSPLADAASLGKAVSFELHVPPGDGYSISSGRIRGSGRVVRVDSSAEPLTGVAVGFTAPLALDF